MNKLDIIFNKIRDVVDACILSMLPLLLTHTPAQLHHFVLISNAKAHCQHPKAIVKNISDGLYDIPMTIFKGCLRTTYRQARQLYNFGKHFPFHVQHVHGWPSFLLLLNMLKKTGANIVNIENYQPITNLNTISKALECVTQRQLHHHSEGSTNTGS